MWLLGMADRVISGRYVCMLGMADRRTGLYRGFISVVSKDFWGLAICCVSDFVFWLWYGFGFVMVWYGMVYWGRGVECMPVYAYASIGGCVELEGSVLYLN